MFFKRQGLLRSQTSGVFGHQQWWLTPMTLVCLNKYWYSNLLSLPLQYVKQLESIREIRGHLKIHKTTLGNMDFFPNLEKINPPESRLLFGKYALAVYDNRWAGNFLWGNWYSLRVALLLFFVPFSLDECKLQPHPSALTMLEKHQERIPDQTGIDRERAGPSSALDRPGSTSQP